MEHTMNKTKIITSLTEVEKLNQDNKEKGVRNFLRLVEYEFRAEPGFCPATKNRCNIGRRLDGYGGIDTPGYELDIITSKGRRYQVVENNIVINTGLMRDFSAKNIYAIINY